jgi:hypothetical protein
MGVGVVKPFRERFSFKMAERGNSENRFIQFVCEGNQPGAYQLRFTGVRKKRRADQLQAFLV